MSMIRQRSRPPLLTGLVVFFLGNLVATIGIIAANATPSIVAADVIFAEIQFGNLW